MSGAKTTRSDNLIRGTYSINCIPLIYSIDRGATYSFISLDCAKKLNMEISHMVESMVIETLANGSVTTLLVCLNFPLTIYGKDFGMDLICLPLSQLDVIMGMNWLVFYHIHINCFDKSVTFPEFEEGEDMMFTYVKQVKESLKDDA